MDLSQLLSSERGVAGQGRATVPPPHFVRSSPPLLQPPPLRTDMPAGPARLSAPHLHPSHTPAGVFAPLPSTPTGDRTVAAAVAPPGMAVMPLAADGDAPSRSRPLPSLLQLGLGRDPLFPPSSPPSTWAAPAPSPTAASSCVSPYGAADLPASAPALYVASPLGASPPVPSGLHSSPLRPLSVGGLQHGLGAAACTEQLPFGRHARAVAPASVGGRSPPPPSPLTPLPVVVPGVVRRGCSLPGFAELSSSLGLGPSALPPVTAVTDRRPDVTRADWQGGAAESSQAAGAYRASGLAPFPLPAAGSAYTDRPDRPFHSPSIWGGGLGGGSGVVAAATGGHLSASWSDGRSGDPLGTPRGERSTKSSPDRSWGVEKRRGSGSGRSVDRAKAFACRLCGYRFGQKGSLHRHIAAVHESRRPHECRVCGKNFAERWTLRVHERNVHEKLKPHSCPVCFKAFGEVWNRDKHVANLHHGYTSTQTSRDARDSDSRGEPHSGPVGDAPQYGGFHRGSGDHGGAGGGVPHGRPAFSEAVNLRGRTNWM